MLMPRYSDTDNHHSSTVAAHTKMRLLSKVEQNMRLNQQNHQSSINKLIHTAATGNGLVGDVDELLMPLRHKIEPGEGNHSGNPVASGKEAQCRPERNLWSRAEMLEMLNIMQQMNALDQLNDRNVKSEHVFRQIEDIMRSKGYVKKSSIQIWTKWKFLKSTYNTTTRHGNGIPKVVPEEVYRVLCRMLSDHSHSNSNSANSSSANGTGGIGSECGNSMDSSNAELRKTTADETNNDELEHPIFGFRLGLVKAEPLDTGYETNLNASEQEMEAVDFVQNAVPQMEHTPFMVKREPDLDLGMDGTNTPPPTAPTSPSPPPSATAFAPLRVASFACSSTPTHGVLQIERPASMLPHNKPDVKPAMLPGKLNRTLPLQSTSSINFVHPTSKLMLPRKQQQQHLPRELRLPRDISLQPASATAAAATAAGAGASATRQLKAVPMRDTGYALRPERMIPDLEQSISPPQSPSPPMQQPLQLPKYAAPVMPAYPSTSRHAQQLHNEQLNPARKRRLNLPQQPSPVPVKLQRSSTLYSNKPHGGMRLDDVPPAPAEESRMQHKVLAEEMQRRKREQQEETFKRELQELANGFRDAQKEMLEDFFQHQKQLARREHEFQLRQDNLVMTALRKQTEALLNTARQLLHPVEQQDESVTQPQVENEAKEMQQHQQQAEELMEQSEQRETETKAGYDLEQAEEHEDFEEHEQHMEEGDEADDEEVEEEEEEDTAQYSDEEEDMQSVDAMRLEVTPAPSEVVST